MAEKEKKILKPFPVPERYLKAKRKAIRSLWCDRLTVIENTPITDKKTHLTDFEKQITVEDQPCRIISQTYDSTDNDGPARAYQTIKVICAEDIVIRPGSIIELTPLNGETRRYMQSGQPLRKSDSQTITLEIIKDYA